MVEIRKHPREVKSILRKRDLVDSYFVGKFAFSPYHACSHGCLYCDGRAERYFVEGEFDRDIVVRTNAARLLEIELSKLREHGIVFIGSGVSDAYQPPELEERLMHECAGVLARRAMPVTVLTKSSTILRDLDLWEEVHHRAGFLLMMSIAILDEHLREAFEPGASPIEERLATLARFRARGIPIGIAAMPFLPFLSDRTEDLEEMGRRFAEIGADFVLAGGLTLRPGRQKAAFFEALGRTFPGLLPRYEDLYSENRPSGAPRPAYLRDLDRRSTAVFVGSGLAPVVPHRLYRDRLPRYDEVHVLLQQMKMLYADRPGAARRLSVAAERYRAWLKAQKATFNRKRRLRQSGLGWELELLARGSGLSALLGNEKLAAFLREVILDRRVFDPLRKELV